MTNTENDSDSYTPSVFVYYFQLLFHKQGLIAWDLARRAGYLPMFLHFLGRPLDTLLLIEKILARESGLYFSAVKEIVNNRQRVLSPEEIQKLADVLGRDEVERKVIEEHLRLFNKHERVLKISIENFLGDFDLKRSLRKVEKIAEEHGVELKKD